MTIYSIIFYFFLSSAVHCKFARYFNRRISHKSTDTLYSLRNGLIHTQLTAKYADCMDFFEEQSIPWFLKQTWFESWLPKERNPPNGRNN